VAGRQEYSRRKIELFEYGKSVCVVVAVSIVEGDDERAARPLSSFNLALMQIFERNHIEIAPDEFQLLAESFSASTDERLIERKRARVVIEYAMIGQYTKAL
jgi:hypothetical protein